MVVEITIHNTLLIGHGLQELWIYSTIIVLNGALLSSPRSWLFNGPKISRFGGCYCQCNLRSDRVDSQIFVESALLGLKVLPVCRSLRPIAKTGLGLVILVLVAGI